MTAIHDKTNVFLVNKASIVESIFCVSEPSDASNDLFDQPVTPVPFYLLAVDAETAL